MIEKTWEGVRVFVVALVATCVFLLLVGSQRVFAHSGGLNKHGCHMERTTGECHCHRDEQGEKISPPVISPDKCGLVESKPKPDKRSEMDFVAAFCHPRGGRIEVTLPYGGRADCITEKHAIEGDFAPKWQEAFRQARHYALDAEKRAGILLILKNENDKVYIKKLCGRIAEKQVSIDVFATGHGYPEEGESVPCADEKEGRSD